MSKLESKKRKNAHTANEAQSPTCKMKIGRPRCACNHAKVKCKPIEFGGPCVRCVKKGITEQCLDQFNKPEATSSSSTSRSMSFVVSAMRISADLDNVDLTDLIEASLEVYNVSAEEWKRIMIHCPSRW
jgi:hypothetical protein